MLDNFSNNLKIVIIGAAGAIGKAMLNIFAANDKIDKIFAISRSELEFDSAKVTKIRCDFLDEKSLEEQYPDKKSLEEEIIRILKLKKNKMADEKLLKKYMMLINMI